jgi:hypothetical protein
MSAPRRSGLMWWGAGYLACAVSIVAFSLNGPAELLGLEPASGSTANVESSGGKFIPPALVIGDWTNIVHVDNRPQPVRLQIRTMEPGKTAGKLIYSNPRRCVIDLQYGGAIQGRHIFYFVPFTNCFRYGEDDYFAITGSDDLPRAFVDLSESPPTYRQMPKGQIASAAEAHSADTDPQARGPMVKTLKYVVHLDGRDIERSQMTRE